MTKKKQPPSHTQDEATPQGPSSPPSPAVPRDVNQSKKFKYFTSAPMRSANHLMGTLYKDDSFYENATYAWVGPEDAKKLFLYGACKEVMKTCISMIEDRDHLQGLPDDKNPDQTTKLITGAITDAQTYRVRKMTELLCTLILFDRNTKRDEEYRVFLNAESLDLALARLQDFRDLFDDQTIANTQHSANGFADRIQEDLRTLGVNGLWFLDPDKWKRRRPGVFMRKKQLFLQALLVASPDERIALRVSYGRGYSQTSQAIHPLLGSHDYGREENKARDITTNFVHLGLVCMQIMHLAHKLAGHEDPGGIDKIMGNNFEKSEASKVMRRFQKKFNVGDIVLTAWEDIGEIVETRVSKYSYTAYRVKFITRPPIPEIPEDWFEARSILLCLMPKSAVRSFYEKALDSEKYPKAVREIMPEILKAPDEELMGYAGKTFLDLHKAGYPIPMLIQHGSLKRADAEDF